MVGQSAELSALVAKARGGDSRALERVLLELAPVVYRFALRMSRSPSEAEDVLQDTLISVAEHLVEFEARSSLSSWAYALARSAYARRHRGLKNMVPASDDERLVTVSDEGPTPETLVSDQELIVIVARAMDGLSDDHREVLMLRDMEGLTASDTARALGIGVDAVKSRLHRARAALRVALEPWLAPLVVTRAASCPEVSWFWSRRLEEELSHDDCRTMESHLASCPACSAACDGLRRALVACRALGSAEVPAELQLRIKRAIGAWAAG